MTDSSSGSTLRVPCHCPLWVVTLLVFPPALLTALPSCSFPAVECQPGYPLLKKKKTPQKTPLLSVSSHPSSLGPLWVTHLLPIVHIQLCLPRCRSLLVRFFPASFSLSPLSKSPPVHPLIHISSTPCAFVGGRCIGHSVSDTVYLLCCCQSGYQISSTIWLSFQFFC